MSIDLFRQKKKSYLFIQCILFYQLVILYNIFDIRLSMNIYRRYLKNEIKRINFDKLFISFLVNMLIFIFKYTVYKYNINYIIMER